MISIILPVFNNSESVSLLIPMLLNVIRETQLDFEIIIVDDGSTDNTFQTLSYFPSTIISYYKLTQNYGQVPAIFFGLNISKGKACIIMSADMQEPVDKIPEMIAKWQSGCDLVIAQRFERKDKPIDKVLSMIFYSFVRLFYKKIPKGGFDFGLVDVSIINKVKKMNPYTSFLQISVIKNSHNIGYIQYTRNASFKKNSSWTISKKLLYASLMLHELDSNFYIKNILVSLLLGAFVSYYSQAWTKYGILPILLVNITFSLLLLRYLEGQKDRELPKAIKE